MTGIGLGTAVATAGCSSDTEDVEGGDNDGGSGGSGGNEDTETESDPETQTDTEPETDSETENESETETPESTGEADIQIKEHELVKDDSGYTLEAYVAVTVVNEGDGPSGDIELTADWYDGNGDYLDDAAAYLKSLGAGETWEARVEALTDTEEIEDYELNGEFATEPPRPPQDVELLESNLQTGEDEATIIGRVENQSGEELSYIEAIGKVYSSDGVVLDSKWTNESEIPAGETWKFKVEWIVMDRADQIEDYEVLLDATAF